MRMPVHVFLDVARWPPIRLILFAPGDPVGGENAGKKHVMQPLKTREKIMNILDSGEDMVHNVDSVFLPEGFGNLVLCYNPV